MNPDYFQTAFDQLNRCRKSGIMTDIVLATRGRDFPAHKIVLIATSDYFNKLLTGSFKETGASRLPIDIEASLFEVVLDAIYGQWKLSGDLLKDIAVARQLRYYQLRGFSPDQLILNVEVSPDQFPEFLNMVAQVYEEGIPDPIAEKLAGMIQPGVDLSEFSNETITGLLSSPGYNPKSLFDIYELIKGLVEKGHSPDLLALINYDLFPSQIKATFPTDFLQKYNKGGPLPRLGVVNVADPGPTKILITSELSVSEYTAIIEGSGKTLGVYFPPPNERPAVQIGDIITGTIRKVWREYHNPMSGQSPVELRVSNISH